jgi:hypothetical protein
MTKAAFTPFSIVFGLLAGLAASKLFEFIWSRFDNEDTPDPKFRETNWKKLIPALALEGAIYRIARGAADHGARVAFDKSVGKWPGEEAPSVEA